MNILKEMILSTYSIESYKQFLQNKKSKVFAFGVTFMAFYFLITLLIPSLVSIFSPTGGIHRFVEDIPDFELSDGVLWVDGVYEFDERDVYVLVDTDPDYVFYDFDEMEPYFRDYTSVLLIDSEKIFIKSEGQVQGMYFSDLGKGFEISKKNLRELAQGLYVCYVMFMIFAYIWMTAMYFFGVLIVALIGMAVASVMKCRLTFGQLYLLGIYTRTLPLIIKALLSLLPFHIPYLIVNFAVSVSILTTVIIHINKQSQQPMGYNNQGTYTEWR